MIEKKDWVKIKRKIPNEILPLMNVCMEFSEFISRLGRLGTYGTTIREYVTMREYTARMVTLCKELVNSRYIGNEKVIGKFESHIHSSLASFYDTKGNLIDDAKTINLEIESGKFYNFTMVKANQVYCFIYSIIYDSLIKTIELAEKYSANEFVNSLVAKTGVLPELQRKTGFEFAKKGEEDED